MLPQTRPYAKLEYEREKEKRRENLRRQIDSLSHQSLKAGVPSSCILNSLWFARNRLNEMAGKSQIGASRNGFELIIISDMLEECDDSPIGRISLNKRDTSKEIALASSMPAGPIAPNFSDVRITIIFPLADNLAFNPRRTASYYEGCALLDYHDARPACSGECDYKALGIRLTHAGSLRHLNDSLPSDCLTCDGAGRTC